MLKTNSGRFKSVNPKIDFPKQEEEILKFWKENKIFEKSIESRPEEKTWTFLDGPPFVTGMPHYGSLLSSLPKDLFGRYWTMKGYRVRRVWGWDGHGLPIENKVENELEITRKRDIEEVVGVKKFIEACKHYVNDVSSEWEWYVDRIGRWVDFKNAYKTWDLPYMETVMWVFKQLFEKDLIYKGLKVSLYCPHCATPISNFEVAMDADNYKEIPDAATTYKYELLEGNAPHPTPLPKGEGSLQTGEGQKTFILAWSTTPWNKIVTPALAVNPKLTYVKVKQNSEYYILAKSTLKMLDLPSPYPSPKGRGKSAVGGEEYTIVEEFKGSELVGKKFVPHYDYYPIEPGEKAFVIIPGNFVTAEEGTGVVTIAAYGQEDLKAMQEHNIHIEMHLDEEGMIKSDVPKFGGMYYLKANKAVNEDLAKRGLIYKDEELLHNVPLCWRCHTRLYYAPINAWFVNVQRLKEQMKKTNEKVNWVPTHFKHGRFLKSLEHAPDWNISRNRYWGSPIPVWECAPPAGGCGERFVPGSIKELEEASGKKITDLHKPAIDEVFIVCKKCGNKAKRVSEVTDSWIEAGSASFGERHYPFGSQPPLENFYPPDFIAEYTGQIRSWFYVLHVIGNALYDSPAFKNVVVEGVILGTDGRKMSKNYKNYPDPRKMLDKYGGDALRLYLLSSPVMNGEDIIISEEQYRNQVKGTMLILWNVYNFFVTYANVDGWTPAPHLHPLPKGEERGEGNVLDQWILSLLKKLISDASKSLDKYDTVTAIDAIKKFVDDLSTWYIRRSRDRVGPSEENEADKNAFYETCYDVLTTLCQIIAPITPFLAEEMYKNLTGEESVHLSEWPEVNRYSGNPAVAGASRISSGGDAGQASMTVKESLFEQMELARKLAESIHAFRKISGVKVKIPLRKLSYKGSELGEEIRKIVQEETNIYELSYTGKAEEYEVTGDDSEKNQDLESGKAREIIRSIQEERKILGTGLTDKVIVTLPDWPKDFENEIKRKALVEMLQKGQTFTVSKA